MYAAFIRNLHSSNYDYSDISRILNIPSLSSHRNCIDSQFIYTLLNNFIDAPDLLSQFLCKVPSHDIRKYNPFYIPTHSTSINHSHPLHRKLRSANSVWSLLLIDIALVFTYKYKLTYIFILLPIIPYIISLFFLILYYLYFHSFVKDGRHKK